MGSSENVIVLNFHVIFNGFFFNFILDWVGIFGTLFKLKKKLMGKSK